MTIEEQVRRMLAEAVAAQPAPSGAPFEETVRRHRRRRRRVAAAIVTALLLAAAVAVAGIGALGTRPTLVPAAPAVPPGWKSFQNGVYNLRFAYPPDWVVGQEGGLVVVPRELAGPGGSKLSTAGPLAVTVGLSPDHYRFVIQNGAHVTPGRLASGRAFIRWSNLSPGVRSSNYTIDWGRYCTSGGGRRRCGPHRVTVSFWSSSRSAWNRYRAVADTIVGSVTQLRPTRPSVGDRSRPACRPDQWRLIWPQEHAFGNHQQRFVHQGGVRYRKGPPCHLRLTLRLALLDGAGRRLPVAGNPATTTIEGDLPEDQMQWLQGSWVIDGPFMWRFSWEEWCNQGLPAATLRVTAEGGATLTSPGPQHSATKRPAILGYCRDRGRPSTLAGWPR